MCSRQPTCRVLRSKCGQSEEKDNARKQEPSHRKPHRAVIPLIHACCVALCVTVAATNNHQLHGQHMNYAYPSMQYVDVCMSTTGLTPANQRLHLLNAILPYFPHGQTQSSAITMLCLQPCPLLHSLCSVCLQFAGQQPTACPPVYVLTTTASSCPFPAHPRNISSAHKLPTERKYPLTL